MESIVHLYMKPLSNTALMMRCVFHDSRKRSMLLLLSHLLSSH